jgi:hypothetical protein
MELRSSTICYSKTKAKETREKLKEAMLEVIKLEQEINTNPTDEIRKKYNENKTFIENYNNTKVNGAIIRSKADWAEFGEKNSKFFLNLEKRNHNMKCITKLINDKEEVIEEANAILKYELDFYKGLYTINDETEKTLIRKEAAKQFQDDTLPKISELDRTNCDKILTQEEVGKALKELKMGNRLGLMALRLTFINFSGLIQKKPYSKV